MILTFIQTIENDEQRDLATKIFEEQFSYMMATAYDILRNKEDAEDAAMNAMKSICMNIDKFNGYFSNETISLIITYTTHAAIDIYRKNQKNSQRFEAMDVFDGANCVDPDGDIEASVISEENSYMLSKALESLDEMYRTPIIMKYLYGMKHDDIAKQLGIDTVTVTGRVFRGRKMLAERLEKMGGAQ